MVGRVLGGDLLRFHKIGMNPENEDEHHKSEHAHNSLPTDVFLQRDSCE